MTMLNPGCPQCACHSPLFDLFDASHFADSMIGEMLSKLPKLPVHESQALLIKGGTIRPMIGGAVDAVQALGIASGKVVACGTAEEVAQALQAQGVEYSELILQGTQTLLPGLIEPHVHLIPSAFWSCFIDMGRFDGQNLKPDYTLETVQEQISAQVHKLGENLLSFWVLGNTVDPALMPLQEASGQNQLVTITKDTLDEVAPHTPVLLLSASMHTAYVNSAALKLTLATAEKELDSKEYAAFEQSSAHGQLQEMPQVLLGLKSIPKMQLALMLPEVLLNLHRLFETAKERGVTMLYDAALNDISCKLLRAYIAVCGPMQKVGGAMYCTTADEVRQLGAYQAPTDYQPVYVSHIKLVSDGSNQGLTGYQLKPYCCNPKGNFGIFNFPADDSHPTSLPREYVETLREAILQNWALMIHANGDQAISYTVQAYSQALQGSTIDPEQNRHRIEHCSLVSADQLKDMKAMGVSPSFLIGHVGYWGYAFKNAIFNEKANLLDLCRTALNTGLRLSLHSDYSVSPFGPLRMMEQAITRVMEGAPGAEQNPADFVLAPQERLNMDEALRAITLDAAWQCNADQWVGSLETGKYADFVILAQDPLQMQDVFMKLRDLPVCSTWVNGCKIYDNPNASQAV